MSLDDLNFKIKGDISDAMSSVSQLAARLNDVFDLTGRIDAGFRRMGASINQISAPQISAPQISVPQISTQLISTLATAEEKAHGLEESFSRKLMEKALAGNHRMMGMLADTTGRARYEMIRLSEASTLIRSPATTQKRAAQGGSGVSLIKVASAVGQLALLTRATSAIKSMKTSIESVGQSSQATASAMTRFRMGLQAAKVDPSLNVAKNIIDRAGNAVAGFAEKMRGVGDATISGIPATIGAIGTALGKIVGSGDSATATISKFVSQIQTNTKGMAIFSAVFPGAAAHVEGLRSALQKAGPIAEGMAAKFDKANAEIAAMSNTARAAEYVLTGTFRKTGTSADLFSRSTFYALLPLRLLKRETEGANRVVRAAGHVFNFLTHPIHAVSLALGQSRAEWKNLNSQLPKLTGGLQLGVRAYRLFAQSAYLAGSAVRAVTPAVKAVAHVAMVGGRAFVAMVGPIRSVASRLVRLTGVQNTFIGKAIGMKQSADAAAGSMSKMGAASGVASRGIAGAWSKTVMLAAGFVGLIVAAGAWGTSTAIAMEKNNVVFGTMLKDMDQGKAVVESLNNSKAAPLFDNTELLNSGRLLFKAGISAKDLAGKTNQLATIATATSTELGDLARIYQQGAVTGSFGQDKINQLAERGIDIYHGLESATGASGASLQKMISEGKIGTAEMDSALAHLTEGQGIYAGAIDNVSATTGGMMSQIKNNVQIALGSLMGLGTEGMKPLLSIIVSVSAGLKSNIQRLAPIFTQLVGVVTGAIGSIWQMLSGLGRVVGTVFEYIFGAGSSTFTGLLQLGMTWVTSFRWFFTNFVDIAKFAFTSFALFGVTAFNDFIYFFTDTVPAYLNWFADNWANVFMDAGNLIVTVFANIGQNIGNAMKQIWAFIASGGTAELQFAFVPLLDGFKATVSELPNVPERAMTQLEQSLTLQTEQIGAGLADSFDKMMADATASMQVESPKIEIKDTSSSAPHGGGETAGEKTSNRAAENKASFVRSSEGQSVVAQFLRGFAKDDDQKKAATAAVASAKSLANIERDTRRGKQLESRGFA